MCLVISIMSETTSKLDLSKEDCSIDKVVSVLEMAEDVLRKLDIVLKQTRDDGNKTR